MPARFSYENPRRKKMPFHNIAVVILALMATAGWVFRGILGFFTTALQVSSATMSPPGSRRRPGSSRSLWDQMPDE